MIFVDYKKFKPSKRWQRKAKKQLLKLIGHQAAGQIAARNALIDGRQYVWSEIKSQIIQATYNKCWFSEGMNDVSHFHIEHFRPKKFVEILPAKLGCPEQRVANEPNCYWWLTFHFKNFRICGEVINSTKGNYFPIRQGSPISNSPSDNLSLEQIILLDPTIEADTELLTFDINGMPIPSANPAVNAHDYLRADISIRVYGLKDELLSNARKIKLKDLNILIDKINRYYHMLVADSSNVDLMNIVKEECSWLVSMTKEHQPFSKMVKTRVKFIPYQWAIDFVIPYLN